MLKLFARTKPSYSFRFRREFETYDQLNEYVLKHPGPIEYYVEGVEMRYAIKPEWEQSRFGPRVEFRNKDGIQIEYRVMSPRTRKYEYLICTSYTADSVIKSWVRSVLRG